VSTRQVALLRGVNLGRHQRVAMADLRRLAEDLGFTDVSTHLQSGNLLLTSGQGPDKVARTLEEGIARELGLQVAVLVRTRDELARTVEANPFADVATDPARLLVSFLSAAPDPAALQGLDPDGFLPERFAVVDRQVYLWCPNGVQASPVTKAFSHNRIGGPATARNLRTVTRILQLLDR
jgi:uncharacterized protein (DUF1697 family)